MYSNLVSFSLIFIIAFFNFFLNKLLDHAITLFKMEYAALWMIQKMPRDYCFVLVVHNSTSVRSTNSFMLSDTWNPMGIS